MSLLVRLCFTASWEGNFAVGAPRLPGILLKELACAGWIRMGLKQLHSVSCKSQLQLLFGEKQQKICSIEMLPFTWRVCGKLKDFSPCVLIVIILHELRQVTQTKPQFVGCEEQCQPLQPNNLTCLYDPSATVEALTSVAATHAQYVCIYIYIYMCVCVCNHSGTANPQPSTTTIILQPKKNTESHISIQNH